MIISGEIPLKQVRFEIYENVKKKTMREVWKEKKSDHLFLLLDGPFFDWSTFTATCPMKIRGKVVKNAASTGKTAYTEWGFAWNDNEAPVWCKLPCEKDNYFTNKVVVVDGVKRSGSMLVYNADADGTPSKPKSATRPLMGVKGTDFTYRVSTSPLTIVQAQNWMVSSKWDQGIIGDGGGSNMAKTATQEIYSSRKIPYFILVYVIDNEPKGEKVGMTEVHVYSKKKEGSVKVADHFKVSEFACKDGSDTVLIHPKLASVLEEIRTHFGKPVNISSGYRTDAYNKKVGGAEYSQHKYGTAADISITGITPKQIAAYAETKLKNTGGIGIYGTFCHVDVRTDKARWNG